MTLASALQDVDYRLLVESAACGLVVLDGDGRIVFAAPSVQAVTGYTVAQATGQTVWSHIHPQDLEICREAVTTVRRTNTPIQVSFRARNRAGDWRLLEGNLGCYRGQDLCVLSFLDVTEANDAFSCAWQRERELERVTRLHAMGELAAAMSHELNQPFAAITSFVDGSIARLQSGDFEVSEIVGALRQASVQAVRAGQVMARMRSFVQRHEVQVTIVDLNSVVESVLPFVEMRAERSGCRVRAELAQTELFTWGDPILLGQVLLNVAFNAVEALEGMPAGSDRTIVVRSDRLPDAVQVAISDNGPGLPPVTPQRLFEAFYSSKPSNLGLGLSLSKTIVESYQGHLWATNIDGLTTFHVSMPPAGERPTVPGV